jgi:putative membrane protein
LSYGFGRGPGNGWLHAKLVLVVLLIGYHHACGLLLKKFENVVPIGARTNGIAGLMKSRFCCCWRS